MIAVSNVCSINGGLALSMISVISLAIVIAARLPNPFSITFRGLIFFDCALPLLLHRRQLALRLRMAVPVVLVFIVLGTVASAHLAPAQRATCFWEERWSCFSRVPILRSVAGTCWQTTSRVALRCQAILRVGSRSGLLPIKRYYRRHKTLANACKPVVA